MSVADGYLADESTEFLEKLVYSEDRVKTVEEIFNKKADLQDERAHFWKLLTLQTKYGYSGKKDAKTLAAEIDDARRMNGSKNKYDGWQDFSDRVDNLLLRQQIIDFKQATVPARNKTLEQIKTILHKNLSKDVISPEADDEKSRKWSNSLEGQLDKTKLMKKKWDSMNNKVNRSKDDDDVKKYFEPVAGAEFLCVQKMNNAQTASYLDLMESESTKLKDNVTLLPFFKQDLEQNKIEFGSRTIHQRIIARDMELLGKKSELLQNDERFLSAWAAKLDRITDLNPEYNDDVRSKYLQKLKKWMDQYVKGGANSLKALILYNLLADQERLGKYDKKLLREYLSVPKRSSYNVNLANNNKKWKNLADMNYTVNTPSLRPIGNDEELVYRYFRKLFQKKDEQAKKWTDVVDADYVKAVLCEARLMNDAAGKAADLKKMYTKVRGKYAVQSLEKKVIVEIEQTNQKYYEVNDVVNIKVLIKNVSELQVNVYAINQRNYYLQNGKEVDINMSLDGLQANYVINKEYKENPFLLRSRSIEIKELKEKRGVFLIDILGNGKRTRALVRKGYLRYIARQEFVDENKDNDLQYVFTVLGQNNKALKDSRVILNGIEYDSDNKGNIYIPFAKDCDVPSAPIILEDLSKGVDTATLQTFDYQTENYSSESGLYLDRESLLETQICPIFIRPNLFLNGVPVSCEALRDPSLIVRAYVGGGGNADDNTTQTVLIKKFRVSLSDKRETVVNYNVPAELRKVELTLSGKIWVGSQQQFIIMTDKATFKVNEIDDGKSLGQCLLIPSDKAFQLKTIGKNGEALPSTKVVVKLKHKYLKELLEYKMQSDKAGMIKLGELPDVDRVEVYPVNDQNSTLMLEKQEFVVPKDTVNIPTVININQGNDVLIPLITDNISPRCDVYDVNFIKIFENVQYNAGYIKISGLPAGSFIAMIRDVQNVDVRINVSKGVGVAGHSVAQDRIVELSESKSLQIVSCKGSRGGGYQVKLDGFKSKYTRVHAISSFGVPSFNAFSFLASPTSLPQIYDFISYPVQFTPDNDVTAEEGYILKRRTALKQDDAKDDEKNGGNGRYGNVLETPSLLINKWTDEQEVNLAALQQQQQGQNVADEEEEQQASSAPPVQSKPREMTRYGSSERLESDPSNLNVLGFPAQVAMNLEPDKGGVVSIPADILKDNHNILTIIALDDNNTSVKYERLTSVSKVPYNDTRLNPGLEPTKHFIEVRDVLLKQKGETVTFDNWPTTTLETYDDFSDVFELYYSIADLNNNGTMKSDLIDFQFLAVWNTMSRDEKLAKYNQYSCNELNFFLKNKDESFFKSVVIPTLSNRLQKSFFDYYLLGETEAVKKYERLDLYHSLNVVEKILLASVVGGKLAENTVKNLADVVSLKRDLVQEFNALFQQALNAKQFEVTSLANTRLPGGGGDGADDDEADVEDVDDNDGDLSRQYQEARYYRVDYNTKQPAELIVANAFWLDFAEHLLGKSDDKKSFLSKNFGFAASCTSEALLALSVISLPFRGNQEQPTIEIIAADGNTKLKSYQHGATVNVTLNGATLFLVRSLKEVEFKSSSLAVATNYFDPDDPFEIIDCEEVDKFVNQSQFVVGKTYGCRVVVTNVSSITYQVDMLCQIPSGSIPVNGGFRTKNFMKKLSSYATSSLEYYFYFPEAGKYRHYPAHISRNGGVIGYSLNKCEVEAVDESVIRDKSSWKYITSGKPEPKDVLEHLKTSTTLRNEDLSKLSWRCGDEKFFKEITAILRRKQLFNGSIWKYSLIHNAEQEAGEYLIRNEKFMNMLAPALTAENTNDPLFLNYNAYERNTYRHVEFFKKDENILGLVNKRIHTNNLLIKHDRFKQMYRDFMVRCIYRSSGIKTMTLDDQFSAIFYLIAQNRIDQATQIYAVMDSKVAKSGSAMMYDYVGVYLSMFEEDNKKALAKLDTVHKWLQVKLPTTKRKMWSAVKKQIAELQDKSKTMSEFQESEIAANEKKIAPKFNFIIDSKKKEVRIKTKNVRNLKLNFFAIDIEQLFSNSPFTAGKDALLYVLPTTTIKMPTIKKKEVVDKDPDSSTDDDYTSTDEELEEKKRQEAERLKDPHREIINTVPFPKDYDDKSNFVLEMFAEPKFVDMDDIRLVKTQYNNSLYVEFNRVKGHVFVGNFSKFPLPKAYVKVYLQTDTNPNGYFLKDGYTDLRGRFDYLTSGIAFPEGAKKAAVLVSSDSCGANIYYVDILK